MTAVAAESNRQAQRAKASRSDPDSATIADIRDDIAALRGDLSDTVSDAAEVGVETAKVAAQRVAGHAKAAHDTVHKAIAARPVAATLIAFGVGALVARVLLPRR